MRCLKLPSIPSYPIVAILFYSAFVARSVCYPAFLGPSVGPLFCFHFAYHLLLIALLLASCFQVAFILKQFAANLLLVVSIILLLAGLAYILQFLWALLGFCFVFAFLVPFLGVHTAWLGCFCILLCFLLCFISPFSFAFLLLFLLLFLHFNFLELHFICFFCCILFAFSVAFSGWLFAFFAFLKVGLHFPLHWFLLFFFALFSQFYYLYDF